MNKKLISILIANLFVAAPALAQDALKIEGSVNLGGIYNNEDATDAAKMNDIRDLTNGALFGWDVKGRSNRYWFDFFGENIGREDQYINLKGGAYGSFKYRLYSDSLTRNWVENGKTPYAGAGSNNHTATGWPLLNTANWNTYESKYDRRDDGGYFEFSALSPWYFRFDANQVTTSGSKIGASSQGMSPGNGYVDLGFPTEFTTKNTVAEGGFSSKSMHVAISWMGSKFENDNKYLDWTNGFWNSGTDRTYLGNDNKYERWLVNATFRQLPLNSVFALRYTKDELKSDVAVGATVLGITNGAPSGTAATQLPTGANTSTFNGRVDTETFSLALTSTPTKGLDTRLYYNDYKREDDSTHMVFESRPVTGPATGAITQYVNEPYSYDKQSWGFDAFYRIDKANRVGAGYEDLEFDRKDERYDYDKSKDKTWFVEWRTSMVDNVTARVKYQNLDRKSDFKLGSMGANANSADYMYRFQTAFDAQDLKQDKWKVTLDATPAEFLDLGLEFIYKDNDYQAKNDTLGRWKDKRDEIYASLSYGDPAAWRFTIFGDWERVKYDSQHRVTGTTTATTPPGPYDPNMPATATNYNWQATNKDANYAYGLAVDWPASEKLKVTASYMYYKTDGQVDFAAPPTIAAASYPQPVSLFDDSKRRSFNLKGVYAFSKTISLTGGWAYEKYDYKDAQYDGYLYTIPAASRADSYLMGYYKDPNYKANIFYGWVTWKF